MNNYQEIIEKIQPEKIKELLFKLGVDELIEKDNCFITNTICHNEEGGSLKLYYYFNNHIFYCYTNCESMSIFKFLKHYYETKNITYDWYEDIYKVILDCSNYKKEGFKVPKYKSKKEKYLIKQSPDLPTYPNGIIDCFIKVHPKEWIQEGIYPRVMDKYNIRYSTSQNKIIIPHYNVKGELVGIRGRALNDWEIENVGKYMPVKIEGKWYSHPLSLNLYGLNWTKDNIRKTGICYIFESEKSVLQCEGFLNYNCAVAVCGSQLNKWQIKILMKECRPKEIVLCFDKEELPNSDKYFNKLYNICSKYKNYANFSFVYDREGLLDLKDSPSDKGGEIFKKLINRRVKVK